MTALVLVLPVLPGRQEAWRRMRQELLGSRLPDYEAAQRRQSITRELAWLGPTPGGELAILYLEIDHPEWLTTGAAGDGPFECWLHRQWIEVHGPDVDVARRCAVHPPLFVWAGGPLVTQEGMVQPMREYT